MAEQAPKLGKAGRDYLRMFLSGAAQEIPDKQFRVTIPPMLREYAGLDRDLAVIGAGTRAEIWDAAAWKTYSETAEAGFSDADGEVIAGLF
jgi:MraZ protein